jgi:hypothetical protein
MAEGSILVAPLANRGSMTPPDIVEGMTIDFQAVFSKEKNLIDLANEMARLISARRSIVALTSSWLKPNEPVSFLAGLMHWQAYRTISTGGRTSQTKKQRS